MCKITVILCASDCSSVQAIRARTDEFENLSNVEPHDLGLPNDFEVIAVVKGWPDLKLRDDARTAEWGVQ